MRVSAIIALAAFAGIAVLSFRGFNEFIEDKAEGLQYLQEYAQKKGNYPISGVAVIDGFVSLMIYMFRDHVLTNQLQWWIFAEWSAVFASLSWLDVEFTRTQLRFVWLYFLLWNFAGLAPFLAVIFLYYTIGKERQSTFSNRRTNEISFLPHLGLSFLAFRTNHSSVLFTILLVSNGHADRAMSPVHSLVTLVRVTMAFAVPAAMRYYSPKSMEYAWAMVSFMVVPSALDLLWAVLPTQPVRSSSGDGFVSKTLLQLSYLIAAVGGAYLHISETYNLLNAYGGLSQIISSTFALKISFLSLPYLTVYCFYLIEKPKDLPLSRICPALELRD